VLVATKWLWELGLLDEAFSKFRAAAIKGRYVID
jgi:hypothetical protein